MTKDKKETEPQSLLDLCGHIVKHVNPEAWKMFMGFDLSVMADLVAVERECPDCCHFAYATEMRERNEALIARIGRLRKEVIRYHEQFGNFVHGEQLPIADLFDVAQEKP